MRGVLAIARKDLGAFFGSRVSVIVAIAMPLFILAAFGYVFPTVRAVHDLPVALVNEDGLDGDAGESAELVARLGSVADRLGTVDLRTYRTEAEAREAVMAGEIQGIIIVPVDYTERVSQGGRVVQIPVLYDATNPPLARVVAATLLNLVSEASGEKARENVQDATLHGSVEAQEAFISPYRAQPETMDGVQRNYFSFLAPGLVAMTLTMTFLSGLPSALARERMDGTLDAVLVAPVPRWSILAGKGLAAGIRSLLVATLVLVAAAVIFGAEYVLAPASLAVAVGATLVGFIGLGVLISVIADLEEGVRTALVALQFPIIMISGIFFPIEQFPPALEAVARVLPTTYAVDALRATLLGGATVAAISMHVIILVGSGIASLLLSVVLFQRSVSK